jgi:hypothetical protein
MGLGVNVAALALSVASQGHRPDVNAMGVAFIAAALLVRAAGWMFTELHPNDGWQVSNRPDPRRGAVEGGAAR